MNKLEWCAVWCGVCSRKYSSGTDGKPTRFHCFSGKWVYDVRRVFAEDGDDNSDTTSTTPSMDDCVRRVYTDLLNVASKMASTNVFFFFPFSCHLFGVRKLFFLFLLLLDYRTWSTTNNIRLAEKRNTKHICTLY